MTVRPLFALSLLLTCSGCGGASSPPATEAATVSVPPAVPAPAAPASAEPARATAADPPPARAAEVNEMFGAKHLLVMYQGSMRAASTITRTKAEARARAELAVVKSRTGTPFEELVREFSDEPGAAKRGGDLGTFRRGQMVPEFQAAVDALKVGEISGVFETPFGFHVALRTR
jgi:hypothetical protein